MNRALVYRWEPDPRDSYGGTVALSMIRLERLDPEGSAAGPGLSGRFAVVRNDAVVNVCEDDRVVSKPVGDAARVGGDWPHEPGRGGGRIDRSPLVRDSKRDLYVRTSYFAQVNTYYQLDRVGAYVDSLLKELGAQSLPRVTAVVHAHNAVGRDSGSRNGVRRRGDWVPMQGGHYRLPSWRYDVCEDRAICPDGEIHLGPGRRRLQYGVLARLAGRKYRHNAGHNAGIIYHEYGHHINRHTADFRANSMRPRHLQSNRKVGMDEGTCDYWAAVMLQSPHIWAWHRRHDEFYIHPRSLVSKKTMAHYDRSDSADPHANGTIWGAALWDLRSCIDTAISGGGRIADLIVLRALLSIGRVVRLDRSQTCRRRSWFGTGLRMLLQSDEVLSGGNWKHAILQSFGDRGIRLQQQSEHVG